MKRTDKNGRVLMTGEQQLVDGSYEYRIMVKNRRYSICCDDLDELREEEKKFDLDKANLNEKPLLNTINDAYIQWAENKKGIKPNTFVNYKYSYEHYVKPSFGRMRLSDLRKSDIKKFYNKLADTYFLKANSIDNVHTVLHQVLQIAADDGIIPSNPSDRALFELRRSHNYDGEKKIALSVEEEKLFLIFVKDSVQYSRWYPIFDVLFHTGMRIGEATALTWNDIDFDNNEIHINKTLVYYSNGGKCTYSINTPKTESGTRTVPMIGDVKFVLLNELQRLNKEELRCRTVVDGITDFVFINRFGDVLNFNAVNKAIKRIVRDCNDQILATTVDPENCLLLPNFSCHNLRHTFATRLYESQKISLKAIQEILGHADISTTLDIYTKLTDKKRKEAFELLCNVNLYNENT